METPSGATQHDREPGRPAPGASLRRRPRFSLLTALLLMTIAAMGVAVAMLWSEVQPLRDEVRDLRLETGRLKIDDPAKAYAVGIPSSEDDVWRSRVYLPSGVAYKLFVYTGKFPKRGSMPDAEWFKEVCDAGGGTATTSDALTGELVVNCGVGDDGYSIRAKYIKKEGPNTRSGGATLGVGGPTRDWLADNRARITATDAGYAKQKEFAADEPILLLHLERPEITDTPGGGFTSKSPTGPADGAVIWLAPQTFPTGGATP